MAQIEVKNVTMKFVVWERGQGVFSALSSLIGRRYREVYAVDDISFLVEKGESVGYVGPNGAGKSTTIKMLTGILRPTSGHITVEGRIPYLHRIENAMQIGMVFGQRSALYWDLPMKDTFNVFRHMYGIDGDRFERNVETYIDLFEMGEFVSTPVRQLSLGQRMRANITLALLHDPTILYLDEPTIGMDVIAKSTMRDLLGRLNTEKKTTVVLTTHDMEDIEQVCDRMLMIDGGRLIYDGMIDEFKRLHRSDIYLEVTFLRRNSVNPPLAVEKTEGKATLFRFDPSEMTLPEAISAIAKAGEIEDVNIKGTRIEDIVKKVYLSGGDGSPVPTRGLV